MRYREILEMALNRKVLAGDWENDDNDTGFSGADRKLQLNAKHIENTFSFFNKTPYPFSFFFINNHGFAKDLETNSYKLKKPLATKIMSFVGPEITKQIKQAYADKDIVVFFTNNEGDEKVPLTPWIMAHRLGHCLASSLDDPMLDTGEHLKSMVSHFIINNYNFVDNEDGTIITNDNELKNYSRFSKTYIDDAVPIRVGYKINDTHRIFRFSNFAAPIWNALGTQASSRKEKILPERADEFLLELFAQYIHDNTITLNPFPKEIHSDKVGYHLVMKDGVDSTEIISKITNYFNSRTKSLLNDCKGKCFIM
jgi:ABC-type antimicrobial peptide transport system permease subunit